MIIKSTRTTVAAAVLFTTLSGLSTIGHAVLEEVNVQSEKVSYADLDLNREEGRETLQARLKSAARRVCADVVDSGSGKFTQNHDCRELAVRQALARIGLEPQTAQINP